MFWRASPKQRLASIKVPAALNVNAPRVRAAGVEYTGQILIEYVASLCGLKSFAGKRVLDVGCGTRFTATIINRELSIGSYTGVDVDKRAIKFLKRNVESRDSRFSFHLWDVHNALYNPSGMKLQEVEALPVSGAYDIVVLLSVFTHLEPKDAEAMLRLVGKAMTPDGVLVFSAFVDEQLDGFEDRVVGRSLQKAYYGARLIRDLIARTGWHIMSGHPANPDRFIQHHFACRPGRRVGVAV